jgi:1-acyl-sn-glycerol-3-phosphate acyltransferase
VNGRALLRLLTFAAITAVVAPTQWLALRLRRGRSTGPLPRAYHRAARRIVGLRVDVEGEPVRGPAVFAANHLSHLDVLALGSVLDASFVAKDEISGWPVLGALCRLQRTVFVSRDPRAARDATGALRDALGSGRSLVLFPEGTSSDGRTVLEFKSSAFALFGDAAMAGVALQPVSLDLVEVDGRLPLHAKDRDLYAYHGDAVLGPHTLRFLATRGARLRIRFHPPVESPGSMGRKQLARLVRERVLSGIQSGRLPAAQVAAGSPSPATIAPA